MFNRLRSFDGIGLLGLKSNIVIIMVFITLMLLGFLGHMNFVNPQDPIVSLQDIVDDSETMGGMNVSKELEGLSKEEQDSKLSEIADKATNSLSPLDSGTLLEANMLLEVPENTTTPTLYIVYDKLNKQSLKEKDKIFKYVEEDGHYPVKIIYRNIPDSLRVGELLYAEVTKDLEEDYSLPKAFLVKNKSTVWTDLSYKDLPLKGRD